VSGKTDWTNIITMTPNTRPEKREYPRARFDWPVTIVDEEGRTIPGKVKDISRGGALVHVGTNLEVNHQVRLAIELPDFDDVISANGKVVRSFLINEQKLPPVYALGIIFTEVSTEDLRYFTGNLAPEWAQQEVKEKQHIKQCLIHQEQKKRALPWAVGLTLTAGLVLLALFFFRLFYQNPPEAPENSYHQEQLFLLSERLTQKVESIAKSSRSLEAIVIQFEHRLTTLENNTVTPNHLEKILSLIASQTLELQRIKNRLEDQIKDTNNTPANTSSNKVQITREPLIYHTVSPGETIFSISRQYGMTVKDLLHLNKLPAGTAIYSNQKLRIKPVPLNSKNN